MNIILFSELIFILQLNMNIYNFKLLFWQVYDLEKIKQIQNIDSSHEKMKKFSDNQQDSLNSQKYLKISFFFVETQIQRYILSLDLILISKKIIL